MGASNIFWIVAIQIPAVSSLKGVPGMQCFCISWKGRRRIHRQSFYPVTLPALDFKLAFLGVALDIPALYMDANSTQSSGFYDLLAWLDANWKKVLIGAIGVVVIVAAIAFYNWKQRQSEMEANKALLSVSGVAATGTNDVNPEELAKVAQQHPNTSAAGRAQLLAAGAAFEKGDYAKAQTQFEATVNSGSSAELKAQAAFGVAASLEAQQKYDEAIKRYEEVARQYPNENVAPQAKLALGRIYEAQNKPEEALKVYSEVENKQGQFEYWQGEAGARKDRLVTRHPELKEKAAAGSTGQAIEVGTPPATGATNP